jgi:hypothetical protein
MKKTKDITAEDLSSAARILGQIGGKSKSEKKKKASKENGKLGGRPKKIKEPEASS